jgi:DNA-binding transcriptional LysR family regulator
LEFYHLRSFVAVAQTGNLTQAAKRLYTTPPAISAHIKTLEDELSTSLFHRSSKGMSLTDKGQLLLEKAQITLDSAVNLVNLAATQQHEIIGTFKLGLNVSPKQVQLSTLAENLQQNCPGISLDIQLFSSGKVIEKIQSQQLDGGYIFGDVPGDFIGLAVAEQRITTVAPMSFNTSSVITHNDLQAQQWIMMGDYCPFDNLLKAKLGPNVPSTLKSSDDGTRLQLVKSGLGLSFLELEYAQIAEKEQQLQIISMLDFSTKIHFVVAKKRATEPLVKALLHEVEELFNT